MNNFIINKNSILNDIIKCLVKLIALNIVLDTVDNNENDMWTYQGYRLVHKVCSDTYGDGLYGVELKFKKKYMGEYKTLSFWMNDTNFMSYFERDNEGEIQNTIEFSLYESIEKMMNELRYDGKLSKINLSGPNRLNFSSPNRLNEYVMYSEWFEG